MIHHRKRLLLVVPVLTATLSGCGVWDAWRYRMSASEPSRTASNYGYQNYSDSRIQPGHSTDADEFNESYTPDSKLPTPAPMERLNPLPVPPSQSDIPPSKPSQPLIERDVRHEQSNDSDSKLIRTLKTPRVFSPEGVRSIYDRFRGNVEEQAVEPVKPDGPIASRSMFDPATRACQYVDGERVSEGPVTLGVPVFEQETGAYEEITAAPYGGRIGGNFSSVMQASPSSFKHPLLADPTGMPYPTR